MDRRTENLTRAQLIVLILFTCAGHFSISITHICGFLGSALWLYKTHVTRSWNQLRWPLWVPFAGFALASLLAVATALDPLKSFEHLKRLFEMGIFFLILNSLSDPILKTSLHGLLNTLKKNRLGQFCLGSPEAEVTLSPRNFFVGLIVLSASASAIAGITQVAMNGLSIHHRISGTLSIHMTFAGILMQSALVAAAYLLFRNKKNPWVWGSLILMLLALVLSLTRHAWLGFGSGLLVLLIFRKPLLTLLLPVLTALLFWLSPAPVQERITSITNLEDITFQGRVSMWKMGWEIYKDYPVTGCGFYCLLKVGPDYPEYKKLARPYTLHSNIVQLAIDTGTVGVLAWLFLWLSYFVAAGRQLKSGDDSEHLWVVLASLSAVTAFLAGGLFQTTLYDSEVVMVAYYLMALPFISLKNRIQ
jgi:hypothetical protein